MFNFIPLIVVIICVIIIFSILIRKFPQLAILDVENMPEEKAIKVKERIVKERISRDFKFFVSKFKGLGDVFNNLLKFSNTWFVKLKEIRDKHVEERKMAKVSKTERLEWLLDQAEELSKKDELEGLNEAEKKLIEAVALDKKNVRVFRDLGEVYYKLKKYMEAKQTLLYALRLLEFKNDQKSEAEINYDLHLNNLALGELDEATNNIIESLKVEPNSPRYLDSLLNLSFEKKNKVLAQETLNRLREVNPENQKLDEWQGEINEISA